MKNIIFHFALILAVSTQVSMGQKTLYVTAENGLIVRDSPSKTGERIGKIPFAEKVQIIEKTDIELSIRDEGETLRGHWVKVEYLEDEFDIPIGYVFDGYLSSKKVFKPFFIQFPDFVLEMEGFKVWNHRTNNISAYTDTVRFEVGVSGSSEDIKLKITKPKFAEIAFYQRFENSITIMEDGAHCDLVNWKHYDSDWKKLPLRLHADLLSTRTLAYSQAEKKQFIEIDMKTLRKYVQNHCSQKFSRQIETTVHVKDYPIGIGMSRMFIKIVYNKSHEKIIEFIMPMGC